MEQVLRLAGLKGVRVVAVCDIRPECADRVANALEERTGARPLRLSGGAEEFRRLCDLDELDVVYICTSWDAHAKVGLYALAAGKHAMIEVPSAMNIDECWALVEAAERNRRHCMQLENCCYGEAELLALNMCRLGLFGELLHGEAAYIHDRRWPIFLGNAWNMWRTRWNIEHAGNQYPTHGIGPIALDMGINRGDRFDYLASWCAVCELSERSARSRSAPVDFPDFTRGEWKAECRSPLMDADIDLSKI